MNRYDEEAVHAAINRARAVRALEDKPASTRLWAVLGALAVIVLALIGAEAFASECRIVVSAGWAHQICW